MVSTPSLLTISVDHRNEQIYLVIPYSLFRIRGRNDVSHILAGARIVDTRGLVKNLTLRYPLMNQPVCSIDVRPVVFAGGDGSRSAPPERTILAAGSSMIRTKIVSWSVIVLSRFKLVTQGVDLGRFCS
jgi:hypothetical protein